MINGYPQTILPFAQKYLSPGSVNTSTDGTTATTFTFESLYLFKRGYRILFCFIFRFRRIYGICLD